MTSLQALKQALEDQEYVQQYQAMVRAMPEHHRRWHAAMIVKQLKGKGATLVAKLTGLHRSTVYSGIKDLQNGIVDFTKDRQRKEHAVRPTVEERSPAIEEDLKEIIRFSTGGDPMGNQNACVRMSSRKIRDLLQAKGHEISHTTVIRLLKKQNLARKQSQKPVS